MGVILSKFWKEKTTYDILEDLELEIQKIEQYSVSTQAQQKRYVGNLLVFSIGLYVLGFIIFYFLFFPPTWMERITYSVPLLIFPIIIFFLKRFIAWYFQRKLNKNSSKLSAMRAEKRKILDRVKDKETYKVALEILNRFSGKPNGSSLFGSTTPSKVTTFRNTKQPEKLLTPLSQLSVPQSNFSNLSVNTKSQALTPNLIKNDVLDVTPVGMNKSNCNYNLQVRNRRTPYPIINQQEKGVLEKMVDYLIGDGPQNRFAMICKECYGHNGMALQEEYEYAAFRCAFCNTLNPSRKLRPVAPKLPTYSDSDEVKQIKDYSSTSSSEKDSGSDSECDELEKNNSPHKVSENESPLKCRDQCQNEGSKLNDEKKND